MSKRPNLKGNFWGSNKMGDLPLPTPESGSDDDGSADEFASNSDSEPGDLVQDYALRITSYDKFTFDQLEQLMTHPYIVRYVIGRETLPQEHYHVVFSTDMSVDESDIRQLIKDFLTPLWKTDKGKLPVGFGNKQYNLQVTETLDNAVTYAVKCKEYRFYYFDEDYLKEMVKKSFVKPDRPSFTTELQTLRDKFLQSDMTMTEFMVKYCQLKAKHDQQINMNNVYYYALSLYIKRDPDEASRYVNNYMDKFER